jgi:hypothetical protein
MEVEGEDRLGDGEMEREKLGSASSFVLSVEPHMIKVSSASTQVQ